MAVVPLPVLSIVLSIVLSALSGRPRRGDEAVHPPS
jgi:hypothetical protein